MQRQLDRMEGKIDTINNHLLAISNVQGEHKGTLKGHATQIAWIWGLVTTGYVAGLVTLIRAVM